MLGLITWVKPLLHLISIPGYLADGKTWLEIWSSIYNSMTTLDLILLCAGVPLFWYAFEPHTWPKRIKSIYSKEAGTKTPLSFEELKGKLRISTELQLKGLYGEKLEIKVVVKQVKENFWAIRHNLYRVVGSADDGTEIHVNFHRRWEKKLSQVRKEDQIFIDGEIEKLYPPITLINCNLWTEENGQSKLGSG